MKLDGNEGERKREREREEENLYQGEFRRPAARLASMAKEGDIN